MGKHKKKHKKAARAQAVETTQPRLVVSNPDKKLRNTVRRYVRHVLICTDSKGKLCRKQGPEVLKAFEHAIKERKLKREIVISEIGHVGGCSLGPNVIVYPEGVWYGRVEPADVDEIVEQHLIGGHVVQRLLRGQREDDPCAGCALIEQPDQLRERAIGDSRAA